MSGKFLEKTGPAKMLALRGIMVEELEQEYTVLKDKVRDLQEYL
jgi:hypothetical protein